MPDLQFCSVISEKQLSALLETEWGHFGGWFCVYIITRDVFKELRLGVMGEPRQGLEISPLCVPLSLPGPANIRLPNICFSISMWIAFVPSEVPNHYPQSPLLSLTEDGI